MSCVRGTCAPFPSGERELLHHRSVALRFFARPDGLFEVEGALIDRKSHPFRRQLAEQDTPAGQPLHDIVVTLLVDESLRVLEVDVRMRTTPFAICPGAGRTLSVLVGMTMGRGWNRQVRDLLGGAKSCTHLVELLGPMATTVHQGLAPRRLARLADEEQEAARRAKVDSCFAYAGEREVVARLWPHLHRSRPNATAAPPTRAHDGTL